MHHQVKLPIQVGKNGKRYTKQQSCKQCKRKGHEETKSFNATLAGCQLVSVVQLTKPQEIALKIMLMKLLYCA
jgi:hypothetical protein